MLKVDILSKEFALYYGAVRPVIQCDLSWFTGYYILISGTEDKVHCKTSPRTDIGVEHNVFTKTVQAPMIDVTEVYMNTFYCPHREAVFHSAILLKEAVPEAYKGVKTSSK